MQYNPEDYIELAHRVAGAFLRKNPTSRGYADDVKQESVLGMLEALKTYKPERTKRGLRVFLTFRCHQKILNYCERYEFRGYRVLKLEDVCNMKSSDTGEDSLSWQEVLAGDVIDIPKILKALPDALQGDLSIFMDGGTREQQRIKMGRVDHKTFTTRRNNIKEALENVVHPCNVGLA